MQLFRAVSQRALQATGFVNAAYFRLVTGLFYSPLITLEKNETKKTLLIQKGRALTGCVWPSEWELAGMGVTVHAFSLWPSVLALLHLWRLRKQNRDAAQLLLNKCTELSRHWLARR